MAELLEEIVDYLIANSIAVADGTDIFRDYRPDKPDKTITLQEYAGPGAVKYADGAARRFQVSVRSSFDEPGWAKE